MNEKELIEFLKTNLKISIDYDGWAEDGDVYKIKLTIKDEEICSTTFQQDYDNNIRL